MELKISSDELWQLFSITPLHRSEALRMMISFAYAIEDLHKVGDLWDHCEKGVEVFRDGRICIHGTLSNREQRLHGAKVDPYRSIAPPEFILSGVHDERSDIFAWGIISYELITGECPVKGGSLNEVIESATKCEFQEPHTIRPDWPERFSSIVMKALSKEPDNRYQNARELIQAMNNF